MIKICICPLYKSKALQILAGYATNTLHGCIMMVKLTTKNMLIMIEIVKIMSIWKEGRATLVVQTLAKVQFMGPKLYKKKGALFKTRILPTANHQVFIFKYTLFISLTLYFDGKFSSVSMASRPPTIGKTTMFWSSTLWSWRHNAGARELSANYTL